MNSETTWSANNEAYWTRNQEIHWLHSQETTWIKVPQMMDLNQFYTKIEFYPAN